MDGTDAFGHQALHSLETSQLKYFEETETDTTFSPICPQYDELKHLCVLLLAVSSVRTDLPGELQGAGQAPKGMVLCAHCST